MKKRNTLFVIILLMVIAGGYIISRMPKSSKVDTSTQTSHAATPSVAPEQNTVIIKDLDFATKSISVKKGTTVTWKNQDTAKHTVTFDDSTITSSELFGSGQSFSTTFTTTGTYTYHCTPHPFMKGSVTVTE